MSSQEVPGRYIGDLWVDAPLPDGAEVGATVIAATPGGQSFTYQVTPEEAARQAVQSQELKERLEACITSPATRRAVGLLPLP